MSLNWNFTTIPYGAELGIMTAFFVVFLALERIYPASPWPAADTRAHFWRNLAFWPLTLAVLFGLQIVAVWLTAHPLWMRPEWLAGGVGLALDFLLLDLGFYLWHRLVHVWRPLKKLHAVHHLDESLDATGGTRFHPLEIVVLFAFLAALLYPFAISLTGVIVYDTVFICASIIGHSNLRWPAALERVLGWFFTTPYQHWVHHHRLPADTNSNYGATLCIWDRLFGTLSPHARTPDMPLGLGALRDRSLVDLLRFRF